MGRVLGAGREARDDGGRRLERAGSRLERAGSRSAPARIVVPGVARRTGQVGPARAGPVDDRRARRGEALGASARGGRRAPRPSVSSSAYSRSAPTGRPHARRVTVTSGRARAARRRCAARSPRRSSSGSSRARPRSIGGSAPLDARVELGDPQVLGVDAVDRRQRAAEHVVAAAELVRALDGDDVAGLLDDADRRRVAALVRADPAARAFGEVEADLAQRRSAPSPRGSRRRARGRPPRGAQDVERERCAVRPPMPGSLPSSVMRRWTGGACTALAGPGSPARPRPPRPPVSRRASSRRAPAPGAGASLSAASTMSCSSSASSGSIASGSIATP